MSLNYEKLEPVLVRDPRTILLNQRPYAVLKSGSQSTWKKYTTTSVSQSSISFSVPPPSSAVITDRRVWCYLPVRLTFTANPAAGVTVLNSGYDAPRAYPIAGSVETLQVNINNQSISVNSSDIIHALTHYNTDCCLQNSYYSMTPCYPDQSQEYEDLRGTVRNPLGAYYETTDGNAMGRGGFGNMVVVRNDVGDGVNVKTAIVDCLFVEPVFMLSPFVWGKDSTNGGGFYNVTSLDFNYTFLAQAANRMWSHNNALAGDFLSTSWTFGGNNGPSSFTSIDGNQPLLLFNYLTPQETQAIPPNHAISYPYFSIERFPTDNNQIVPSYTQSNISSNNIQLKAIPQKLYIYVRQRNNDLQASASNTDTFFQINRISMQFMNKSGLFASASMDHLYSMSVSHGCAMSWTQWSGGPVYGATLAQCTNTLSPSIPSGDAGYRNATHGTIGSVLCIEFATNVGLDSLDAPGKLGQYQIQVDVTCTNLSKSGINPTLYLVPIYEGALTINAPGSTIINTGVLTSKDILEAQSKAPYDYDMVRDVMGGNFFSDVKDFFTTKVPQLNDWLRKNQVISKTLKTIPGVHMFAPAAKALGYGEGEDESDGGVLLGGARLPRKSLKHRLR